MHLKDLLIVENLICTFFQWKNKNSSKDVIRDVYIYHYNDYIYIYYNKNDIYIIFIYFTYYNR